MQVSKKGNKSQYNFTIRDTAVKKNFFLILINLSQFNLVWWLGLIRVICFLIDLLISYWFGFQSMQGLEEGQEEGRSIRIGARINWKEGWDMCLGTFHWGKVAPLPWEPHPFVANSAAASREHCLIDLLTHFVEFCRSFRACSWDRGLHGQGGLFRKQCPISRLGFKVTQKLCLLHINSFWGTLVKSVCLSVFLFTG